MPRDRDLPPTAHRCSFCGKAAGQAKRLFSGHESFICDECVELCMDIIREENKSSLVKSRDGIPTPKEIRKVLDDYVTMHLVGIIPHEEPSHSESDQVLTRSHGFFFPFAVNDLVQLVADHFLVWRSCHNCGHRMVPGSCRHVILRLKTPKSNVL